MNKCDCLDFPVSWDHYRAHCWEAHGFDPGSIEPQVTPPIRPVRTLWDKPQWDTVQQLRGQMLHLEKKVDTLTTKKRKERSNYD